MVGAECAAFQYDAGECVGWACSMYIGTSRLGVLAVPAIYPRSCPWPRVAASGGIASRGCMVTLRAVQLALQRAASGDGMKLVKQAGQIVADCMHASETGRAIDASSR